MSDYDTTHIGTSGWQHQNWKSAFYPRALQSHEWLSFYAGHFNCVEVNSSFYAMPDAGTINAWCSGVPESFLFTVKAPRELTHVKKLKNCDAELAAFFDQLKHFGNHLGPVIFQLPARWRFNEKRLADFLERIPADHRLVFEFRDQSWHNNEVYRLLKANAAAFCVYDYGGFTAPIIADSDLAYVRLCGPGGAYARNYRAPTLRAWVDRAIAWKQRSKHVFLIFDNDERACAVKNATRTIGLLNAA
jgi:uncharacterized protein YecE (DUF72 family)